MAEQTAFFLKYLPMKISLISMETAVLPAYLGSTLRGVLGQALHHDTNAFNYLYNNRALSDNQQDIINPYVIVPPSINEAAYHAGEELSFEIYLLGDAAQHSQSIINALRRIQEFGLGASRHPFVLIKVTHSLDQRIIWQNGIFYTVAAKSTILPYRGLSNVKQLTIRVRTPLRIRRDGALLEKVDFPTIIRNITRRVEALATRYGGWVDKEEIERIQMLSAEVSIIQDRLELKNMERYSARLGEKMDFSGLMGVVRFEGELTPFVPWLYGAQTLHIGRNTTFGMGRIKVEFV
jgi:hypothetical protein